MVPSGSARVSCPCGLVSTATANHSCSARWLLDVSPVAIASMEMPPVSTVERMLCQVTGLEMPHIRQAKEFSAWTDDRLWIYDQQDSVPPDRILGMIRYAIHELDIRHIVIDSLMKCGIKPDDYGAQKEFVDRLCWSVKNTNAHIHLVLHMRKGRSESDIPSKFDVKGAGEISDLADNLFIIPRNKDKEEKIDAGELVPINVADQTLTVAKQRHGKWEGRFHFFFHKPSQQYLDVSGDFPMTFPVEFSAFPDREALQ